MAVITQDASPQKEAEWWDLIGKFRAKAAEFDALYTKILNQKDTAYLDQVFAVDWNNWIGRAEPVRIKLKSYRELAGGVVESLQSDETGVAGLGLVWWAVPIGVIGTFLASMHYVTSDGWLMSRKLDFVESEIEKGVPAADAIERANKLFPKPGIDVFTLLLGAGVVVGAMWLLRR